MRNRVIIIFGLLFGLLSCNETPHHRNVFHYNESKGIASLDPAFAKSQTTIWPTHQLFNGLVQLDSTLHIKPCIAKQWDIDSNRLVYSFHLRQDVFFHTDSLFKNGTRNVVASDFVYSFNRLISPQTASPGSWIFGNIDTTKAQHGFEAIDDTTLRIYLKRPFPGFLGLLSMVYCSVVPHEVVDFYKKDFRRHPVGTGPFMFKLWKEGERLILVKNPHYFETDRQGQSLPYLDGIAISFLVDKQSEFLEFLKGNIDFISGVTANNKDQLLTRQGTLKPIYRNRFTLHKQPYLNTEYLGFQLDSTAPMYNPIWRNRLIRKAFNLAIDKEKLLKYLRNGMGFSAKQGFIPKGLPSFSSKWTGFSYNPSEAKKLLSLAGYPNGKGLPPLTLSTTSDYLDICEFIQHEVEDIGFHLNIDVNTGAAFREMVANGKTAFFRASWIADYPDAENYLALFYSKNFSPEGPNYTHFNDSVYDALYEQALIEPNDNKRQKIYHTLDSIIIDQATIVPLFYDMVVDFTAKNIIHFETNPLNLLELKTVKMKLSKTKKQ